MKYTTKAAEKSTVKITIKFDGEEWKNALQTAYMKARGKFAINGFRKGKAPRNVIENMYGKGVFFEDAFDHAFSDEYREVLKNEKDFDPIAQPDVTVKSFDDNGIVFVAEVEVMPEVKLGEYKGTKIKKATGEISEEKIEKEPCKIRVC